MFLSIFFWKKNLKCKPKTLVASFTPPTSLFHFTPLDVFTLTFFPTSKTGFLYCIEACPETYCVDHTGL